MELLVFLIGMLSQIFHVLININQFVMNVLVNLEYKASHLLSEVGVLAEDKLLILFVALLDEEEEGFKVLLVIQDKFVDYGFVELWTGEFVRIALVDYSRYVCEMLGDVWGATLLDKVILTLDFLEEFHVGINVLD